MTRRLVLLRHAKSAWPDLPDLPDHERPLARRGRRDAPAAGRWLREAGLVPGRVLCSTARRTRETWQLMVPELGATLPPVSYQDAVYAAHGGTLLEAARQTETGISSLMIIGHNPGIQELALLLAAPDGGAGAGLLQRAAAKFPTAAIAVLTFAGDWPRLGPGRAQLTTFVTPGDLRQAS